ncbi:MAG: PAS domain S-box protein [Vicinamibacteria bacterium]|nr:PAS domain S-box protein [Vicinamibacteria bacterium]
MPHFDGLSALELLKASGLDLPFILVSGTVGEDVAVAAMRAGAHDYLMKDHLTRLAPAVRRELAEAAERFARRQAEAALQESEERYRTMFESMIEGFCVLEVLYDDHGQANDLRFLDVNPAFEGQTGLRDVKGRRTSEVARALEASWIERYARIAATGEASRFEDEAKDLNRWFSVSAYRVGEAGRRTVGVLFHDITARKQAEASLRASLREKEALLKEVHHRVKNNLQVITSLMRLETSRTLEPSVRRVLKEMQGRIMSMALLHETLYRSGVFARVDLARYVQQLAGQLFRAHEAPSGRVRLSFDLAFVEIDIDRAIPCGLIVNELLANSLRHAFPDGQSGEVRVRLRGEAEGVVRLEVQDTGRGFPEDLEARRGKSLGLQLVSDLARQLGGSLELGPARARLWSSRSLKPRAADLFSYFQGSNVGAASCRTTTTASK